MIDFYILQWLVAYENIWFGVTGWQLIENKSHFANVILSLEFWADKGIRVSSKNKRYVVSESVQDIESKLSHPSTPLWI